MGALEERIIIPDGDDISIPEEEEEEEEEEETTIPDGLAKNALVAASLGAGALHLWAGWAHSSIFRVLVFFVVVATVQLWLAAAVVWVRNIPWSVLIGTAVFNAGVVVVWALSRTTGVPGQPESMSSMDAIMNSAISDPGTNRGAGVHEETFGLADTASSLLEVVVVLAVVVLWMKHRRPAATGVGDTEDPAATASPEEVR